MRPELLGIVLFLTPRFFFVGSAVLISVYVMADTKNTHSAWLAANKAMLDADAAFLEGIKAYIKENPFTPYHIVLDRLKNLREAQAEARQKHDKILSEMR